jgi:hypothetical protein
MPKVLHCQCGGLVSLIVQTAEGKAPEVCARCRQCLADTGWITVSPDGDWIAED